MRRWPIIRHIRWFYLNIRFTLWWNRHCAGLFVCPNQSDLDYLQGVWEGKH